MKCARSGPSTSRTESSESTHSRVSSGSMSWRRSMAGLERGSKTESYNDWRHERKRGARRPIPAPSLPTNQGHRARSGIVCEKSFLSYYKTEFLRACGGDRGLRVLREAASRAGSRFGVAKEPETG